jgi:hypothetical protein
MLAKRGKDADDDEEALRYLEKPDSQPKPRMVRIGFAKLIDELRRRHAELHRICRLTAAAFSPLLTFSFVATVIHAVCFVYMSDVLFDSGDSNLDKRARGLYVIMTTQFVILVLRIIFIGVYTARAEKKARDTADILYMANLSDLPEEVLSQVNLFAQQIASCAPELKASGFLALNKSLFGTVRIRNICFFVGYCFIRSNCILVQGSIDSGVAPNSHVQLARGRSPERVAYANGTAF